MIHKLYAETQQGKNRQRQSSFQLVITKCDVIHDCAASQGIRSKMVSPLQGLSLDDAKCSGEVMHIQNRRAIKFIPLKIIH